MGSVLLLKTDDLEMVPANTNRELFMRAFISVSVAAVVLGSSSFALAADEAVGGTAAVSTTTPPVVASTPPKETNKEANKEANEAKGDMKADGTDHEKVVRHLAVGYLGAANFAIGAAGTPGSLTTTTPIIGARYWLNPKLGIDAGLGLGHSTSSTTSKAGVVTDGPSTTSFGLHGGVPLAFGTGKHYTFLIIPEAEFGYATTSVTAGTVTSTTSALSLNLGGRVGAEVQFGFIGVPELSLQASVGLMAQISSASFPNDSTSSSFSLGTTVQGAPWAIFANSISALYYLP